MTDTTLRQWLTLRAIPRHPRRASTREIWQKLQDQQYAVSKRTVERDLDKLSGVFHYTSESEGKTTYWFWPENAATLDIPGMEPAAAITLTLAREHLQPLLPASVLKLLQPYFKSAEAVLTQHSGAGLGHWRHKVRTLSRGPRLAVPQIDPTAHAAITEALLHGRQLTATYHRRGSRAAKETRLNPLGLVTRDGLMYLIATAWDYTEPYQYALHRFRKAEVIDTKATLPDGFSLDQYIQGQSAFEYPHSKRMLALVADFEPGAADHLQERALSEDQSMSKRPDGWVRIRATVPDTAELRWWLKGYGASVRVIGPKKIRAEFQGEAKALMMYYQTTTLLP
jgi:predicted DNA-binding transcriptional regulator YafY